MRKSIILGDKWGFAKLRMRNIKRKESERVMNSHVKAWKEKL
jgi:predicted nuclease of predicted toxin-antitoxin system